jgi:hypothetical protein
VAPKNLIPKTRNRQKSAFENPVEISVTTRHVVQTKYRTLDMIPEKLSGDIITFVGMRRGKLVRYGIGISAQRNIIM